MGSENSHDERIAAYAHGFLWAHPCGCGTTNGLDLCSHWNRYEDPTPPPRRRLFGRG